MKRFKDKKTLLKVKEELKKAAVNLRETKPKRRPSNNLDYEVYLMKCSFRHKHIAYCLLRGTPMELIETPRDDNQPNESIINDYIMKYGKEEEPTE